MKDSTYNVTEINGRLWNFVSILLLIPFIYYHAKLEITSPYLSTFSFIFVSLFIWTLTYHFLKRKVLVKLTSEKISLTSLKHGIYWQSKTQNLDWEMIYKFSQSSSWTAPHYVCSDLNLYLVNGNALTLTRLDFLNRDDFNKLYTAFHYHSEKFKKLKKSELPKPVTIFETRWIQTAMIFISIFAVYVGYNLYVTEEKGALIVTTIFGLGSLYYWYRVLDNWSKKR